MKVCWQKLDHEHDDLVVEEPAAEGGPATSAVKELSSGADKVIGGHARCAEEAVLDNVGVGVHVCSHLLSEGLDGAGITAGAANLADDEREAVGGRAALEVGLGSSDLALGRALGVGVEVSTEVVGLLLGAQSAHEVGEPGRAGIVASGGRADEEAASGSTEREELRAPVLDGHIHRDASTLRLVEVVDDALLVVGGLVDSRLPQVALELVKAADHGLETDALGDLGGDLSAPVDDSKDLRGRGDRLGAGLEGGVGVDIPGVGPVPEHDTLARVIAEDGGGGGGGHGCEASREAGNELGVEEHGDGDEVVSV